MKITWNENKIKFVLPIIFILILFFVALGYFLKENKFEYKNPALVSSPSANIESMKKVEENKNYALSPITGESCENADRRPVAVMLAIDRETRPLSGLSEADMVFEMPVITNGATRLMAVFGCNSPKEIGSIRSARHDFIDLADSVDAIFAHWGGSHFALDALKTGVIDNLDALVNYNNAFYRKNGIAPPHNGFTNGERLWASAEKLGYRLKNNFFGFLHLDLLPTGYKSPNTNLQLIVGYPKELKIEYKYDGERNSFLRWRGGIKEIDKNNGLQISVKNIAVIFARSKQIEGDYNDVELDGAGRAEFYFYGDKTNGRWKKDGKKIIFLNELNEDIKFMPGNIWVEIVQADQKVEWSGK